MIWRRQANSSGEMSTCVSRQVFNIATSFSNLDSPYSNAWKKIDDLPVAYSYSSSSFVTETSLRVIKQVVLYEEEFKG